jgi:hypothetical protein
MPKEHLVEVATQSRCSFEDDALATIIVVQMAPQSDAHF